MNKEILLSNIDKVHTTEMGIDRIKKNLKLENDNVVEFCKNKVLDKNCNIYKQGKNWYCEIDNMIITINSYSYTIITAHIKKIKKESKDMRKIIIAGSAKFYIEALEFKRELESKGYEVIDYPKNINVNDEQEYKEAYERFYNSLSEADDLILFNQDKNGIRGYIGYESFAELSNLVVKKIQEDNNHKIYIYKMPSKEVGCYDEIMHFLELGYIELYN